MTVLALAIASCANRGMQAPNHDGGNSAGSAGSPQSGGRGGSSAGRGGTGGIAGGAAGAGVAGAPAGRGGSSSGGSGAAGGTAGGAAGATGGGTAGGGPAGSGPAGSGPAGSGGSVAGSGGSVAGSGGSVAGSGGSVAGSGGSVAGSGGSVAGSGGSARGGSGGSVAGSGGSVAGSGGSVAGSGGAARGGSGGSVAGSGGRGGGVAGAGGTAGGAAGAAGSAYVCPLGGALDCGAGALELLPDGTVTAFSALEWNATSEKWCNALGLDGHVFAYAGAAPSASVATVETTGTRGLMLDMDVAALGYAGGGLIFDSCVDASGFNSIEFTASTASGSLSGCSWQVQIQTQDQRPNNTTDPTGGTCPAAGTCYRFPAVANLANPTPAGMTYTQAFTAFSNPASSTIPARTQIVGVQFQVNSANSGTGTCAVVLRIDDIKFVTR